MVEMNERVIDQVDLENYKLDKEELENVAGGFALCLFVGVSTDVSAEANRDECHACAFIGVGMIDCTR